ncbi:MAG TPA: cupredoxin domain-containing protein [Actinomycetota bacterium]|nr:cupredoxin domain-containing protein [Actinomycetota bacterium]
MPGDRRIVAAAVLALALLASACGGGAASGGGGGGSSPSAAGGSSPSGGALTIGGEEANDHGSRDVSGETEVRLEADDFYFEPTVLEGSAGQQLTIEVENEGNATHTFTIDEQGIDEELSPGGSATVTVTFPDSGQVVFYCRFHRTQGMLGALEVG